MEFTKKRFGELAAAMMADVTVRTPELTDFNEGSVARTLLEAFAYEVAVLYEQMDRVYQSGFVDTARGVVEPRQPPPPVMSAREFRSELQRLIRAYGDEQANPGSISCEGCRRCERCMFCVDCEECYRCTHSRGCQLSSHLTHCVDCVGCHDCAYCVASENCTRSNYLLLSRNCSECSYCFGCVGLSKKDFHILNKPYDRGTYFKLTNQLARELGLA